MSENIGWKTEWRIDRFRDPEDVIAKALQAGMPMEKAIEKFRNAYLGRDEFEGNIALNEGLQLLIDIICGIDTTSSKWDNTNARIGVGDSSASESASQTGLQGTSKSYKGMDTGYPQRSGQTAEWRATFGSDEGNHGWKEFTVVNGPSDAAKNLNRKVADKGTKSSGESWTASVKVTFS